jgi:hypothetical protein
MVSGAHLQGKAMRIGRFARCDAIGEAARNWPQGPLPVIPRLSTQAPSRLLHPAWLQLVARSHVDHPTIRPPGHERSNGCL